MLSTTPIGAAANSATSSSPTRAVRPARPAGYQPGEPDEPERRRHAGHGRHEQRGGDEVPAGQQPDGGDRRGIAGEERVRRVRRVPAERVDEHGGHVVVAVVRDVEQPDGVPAAQRRDQRHVAPGRHEAEHGDPDERARRGRRRRGRGRRGRAAGRRAAGGRRPRAPGRAPVGAARVGGPPCAPGRCPVGPRPARPSTPRRPPSSGAARRCARRDSARAARQPAAGRPRAGSIRPHRSPVPEHGRVPGCRKLGPVDAEGPQRRRDHRPHWPPRPVEDLERPPLARPGAPRRTRPPPRPSPPAPVRRRPAGRRRARCPPPTTDARAALRRPGPPGCRATRWRCARTPGRARPECWRTAGHRSRPPRCAPRARRSGPRPSSAPLVADSDRDRGTWLYPNRRPGRWRASPRACQSSSGPGRTGVGPLPASGRLHPGRAGGRGVLQVVDAEVGVPPRMRRTPSRCAGSPEWLAAASASRAPSRSRPARSMATAWSGLTDERGKNVTSGSPAATIRAPRPSSPTTWP